MNNFDPPWFLSIDLVCEKVENVPQGAAFGLIEFGVFAARAGDAGEMFVLYVEYFAQRTASRSHFTDVALCVAAFWASVIQFLHVGSSVILQGFVFLIHYEFEALNIIRKDLS